MYLSYDLNKRIHNDGKTQFDFWTEMLYTNIKFRMI